MVSWGLEVNDYGNAIMEDGKFVKVKGEGVTEEMWEEMVAYAEKEGWKAGDYKKLNLPFENRLMGLSQEVRERMVDRVADFTYDMLVDVFNAGDTAPLALEAVLKAGSYDIGPKVEGVEDPAEWTKGKIAEKGQKLESDKGPEGDFDD